MKKTPLYEVHKQLNGRIVDFGGWELPVQYTSIIEEHMAVRNTAGLFDVSHMGEIIVSGKDAEEFIQKLVTNSITGGAHNTVVYSPICYEHGGTVDDLFVYKLEDEKYLLVVNASNTQKDYEWFSEHIFGDVKLDNVSDKYAQIALQGPYAQLIMEKTLTSSLGSMKFMTFSPQIEVGGVKVLLSRSGYTGQDGFELYFDAAKAVYVWELLMEAGREYGICPAGLGARDTLRLEAALPLYGQELSPEISPLEAGLGRFVKFDKQDFIGREALLKQYQIGLSKKIIGLKMIERGIPRTGYEVYSDGIMVGKVTSGSFCPALKENFGLALVDKTYVSEGRLFEIKVRDNMIKAQSVATPIKRWR